MRWPSVRIFATLLVLLTWTATVFAQRTGQQPADLRSESDILSDYQWTQVDEAVSHGLSWLARQQNPDGSFPTMPHGQPGVTGLCALAFMAHGHLPGSGPYGRQLERAVEYIVSCQKRNGVIAQVAPNSERISQAVRRGVRHEIGFTACYNHAIGGLVLSEAFAMEGSRRARTLQPVITKALQITLEMQDWPKDIVEDEGGWRYLDDYDQNDSDLSITGWQLMFLRSAKNAGFDVAEEPIDRAIGYVLRCFRKDVLSFTYKIGQENRCSRGMAGAGVLALAHAGMHNTQEAQLAGDWILRAGFDFYNAAGNARGIRRRDDRYHYGLLTCCQAMYQLGGRHWEEFYPRTIEVVLANQHPDGAWDREGHRTDRRFQNAYTTAICIIALGASNQLLPVFQR